MLKNKQIIEESMRLDKWLWCARFYKTRNLATSAVRQGKVRIEGTKVKAARLVHAGDKIEIQANPYQYDIIVNKLAKSRGSATDAALLFHESRQSIEKRAALALQLRLSDGESKRSKGRPDKYQRRKIIRFTRR
jgi:ribosome-associated heat shock protein Hsp15